MLVERCELLSTLLALYEGLGHPCTSTRALELVRVLNTTLAPAAGGSNGAGAAAARAQDAAGRALVAEHLVGACVWTSCGPVPLSNWTEHLWQTCVNVSMHLCHH
jgi:hypothetical protein